MGEYAELRMRQERMPHRTRTQPPVVEDLGAFKLGTIRFRAFSNGVIYHMPKGASLGRGEVRISRAVGSRAFLRSYPPILAEHPCTIEAAKERAAEWLRFTEGEQ